MSILDDIRNIKGSPRDFRNFGLLVGGIFLGLGLFLYFSRGSWPILVVIGAILFLLGLVAPKTLRPIYKAWMTFGTVVGFFVTGAILTVFFYVIFTPFALVLRLCGKHFLELKFKSDKKSYWNYRSLAGTKDNLEKQF